MLEKIWAQAQTACEAILIARAYHRTGQIGLQNNIWILAPAAMMVAQYSTNQRDYQTKLVKHLLLHPNLKELPSQGRIFETLPNQWSLTCYRILLAFTIATMMGLDNESMNVRAIDEMFKLLDSKWIAQLAPLRIWLTTALPNLHEGKTEAQAKRAVLTYLRLHGSLVYDWALLLGPLLPTPCKFRTMKRAKDPLLMDILSNDEWPASWEKYVDEVLPGPIESDATVSLEQLWQQSSGRPNFLRLARAYYRTGQLEMPDQVLLMGLTRPVDIHSVLIGEFPRGQLSDICNNCAIRRQPNADVGPLLQQAIAQLSPLQYQLFRHFEFITYAVLVTQLLPDGGSAHVNGLASTIFNQPWTWNHRYAKYMPGSGLFSKDYVKAWQLVLGDHLDITMIAYTATRRIMYQGNVGIRLNQIQTMLETYTVAPQNDLKQPILRAYFELVTAGPNPVPHLSSHSQYPQLYVAVIPITEEEPGFQLPPVLNGIIYAYAFHPTYDEILQRLPSLGFL